MSKIRRDSIRVRIQTQEKKKIQIHFSVFLWSESGAGPGPDREVVNSCEQQVSDAPDHLQVSVQPGDDAPEPGSLSPLTPLSDQRL